MIVPTRRGEADLTKSILGLGNRRMSAVIRTMSYQGTIQNGQIKLPPDAVLPEGASVVVGVELREELPSQISHVN